MKKTKLTRSLLAACSIVALTAVMYGCVHDGGSDTTTDETDMEMPDPAIAERAAIKTAIDAASTAVGAVTDTASDAIVTAADTAITAARTAITNAENVPAEERAANTGTVDALASRLTAAKTSRTAAMDDAAEAERMRMAADGKALHGALTANPLDFLDDDDAVSLGAAGLAVNPNGTTDDDDGLASVTLTAGASAGSLGGWAGTNYAHTATGTKIANSAVVYTNQGPPTTHTFASQYTTGYTAVDRELNLATATELTANGKKMASRFPTVGTTTYTADSPGGDEVSFPGRFDGASGTYTCTDLGTTPCTAAYSDDGITLTGGWTFTHAAGAMVSRDDPTYLYFGWWLRKDDGKPTHASAFTGTVGAADAITAITPTAVPTTGGSATYTGAAAGKFAINNPLGGSDAGHFTADATLTAKFGGTGAGVTGTIDNFMANGNAVPWSVALNNNTLAGDTVGAAAATNLSATGGITSALSYDTATPNVDESKTTVWSIDGNAAPASGTWSGQMYDEAVGAADDGSNVPTTVTGVFQSMFGSTHTMVGAFGADKQ